MTTCYRAKAPLRLGLGGGGTDLAVYASMYGGAILNATISMYARVSLEPLNGSIIEFYSPDRELSEKVPYAEQIEILEDFPLQCGVYNRLMRDYHVPKQSFRMITSVDAPPGSGLGSSSTLVVAMLAAFAEWFRLPLGEYELAKLAYDIERSDLRMAGGKQDQFAATFGGVNFMEFLHEDVLVNPLRIQPELLNELEHQCILVHTRTSRLSSEIITEQIKSITQPDAPERMDALHKLKENAYEMKAALLKGDFTSFGNTMHKGWLHKKHTANHISNSLIDEIYEAARNAGALGGKVSGAGGGGFMFLFCDGNARYSVIDVLEKMRATVVPFSFTQLGVTSWRA